MPRSRSIRFMILASHLSVVFLLVLCLGAASYLMLVNSLSEAQKNNLTTVAHQTSDAIRQYLNYKAVLIEKMSRSREVEMYALKYQELPLARFFNGFKEDFPVLSLVNEEGLEEVKTVNGKMSHNLRDLSETAVFGDALEAPNEVVFSDATYSADIGGKAIIAAMAKYQYFGDRFSGIIMAAIPLSQLENQLLEIPLGKTGSIYLIDDRGRMLSNGDHGPSFAEITGDGEGAEELIENAKVLKEGFGRATIEGVDSFVAYAPVRDMKWSVMAALPYAEFIAPVHRLRNATTLIFLVIFTIGAIFILGMTNHITRPIAELVTATRQIARGDFSMRVDIQSGDEIGALAESFNAMAQNLQITYEKMEEKTRQLIEAQEELVRKEKLSILGQLSGSMGHELRNPLGVISNAVYYLQTVNPNADETTKEYLGIIKDEVETSQRIISDLLEFARTKAPNITQAHAGELVAQSLEKCAIPATVSVNLDLPDVLPPLRVDPVQIKQVFISLIMNAVQAMPDGGILEIKAEEASGGKELKVSFTDTGEGIAPENMDKLFQPLFTTKARGIGLGLTASQNLTENNGGRIEVESKVGEGTTFTVTLPAGEA